MQLLEKASVIPRAYKSVFLSSGPVNDNTMDPTISTNAPVFPSLSDSVKEQYAIGQSLSLVRDRHYKNVILKLKYYEKATKFEKNLPPI